MRECTQAKNTEKCSCTFSCPRKGVCCECVSYHRSRGELPGCYFPQEFEKTGDRSVESFILLVKQKGSSFIK